MKATKSIQRGEYSTNYFSPEFTIKTFKKSYDPEKPKHEAFVTFHAGNCEYVTIISDRKQAAYALKRMKKILTQSLEKI